MTPWGVIVAGGTGARFGRLKQLEELGGRRVQTAIALKGPSAGNKITIASYGKNADQIVRLFEEPAELFIVQANGFFESTLVKHVDQTARAVGRPVNYCLVDGTDTARLLLALADRTDL